MLGDSRVPVFTAAVGVGRGGEGGRPWPPAVTGTHMFFLSKSSEFICLNFLSSVLKEWLWTVLPEFSRDICEVDSQRFSVVSPEVETWPPLKYCVTSQYLPL